VTGKQLSVTLIASALTGLGYVCVYLFDLGYCVWFGIPLYLITISIQSLILTAAIGLISYPLVALLIGYIAPSALAGDDARVSIIWVRLCLLCCLPAIWVVSVGPLSLRVVLTIATLLFSVVPISFVERLISRPHQKDPRKAVSLWSALLDQLGTPVMAVPFVAFAFGALSVVAGQLTARTLPYFPVTVEHGVHRAVLAFYGDSLIAAEFDESTKIVYPNFKVYDMSKDTPEFKIEKVGPLVCSGCR
jgi:hypothetical protein